MAAAIMGARCGRANAAKMIQTQTVRRSIQVRRESLERAQLEREQARQIFELYDHDRSNDIDRAELKVLLGDYSVQVFGKEQKATDEDIDFILALCERKFGKLGDRVKDRQVLDVCLIWFQFLEREQYIRKYLAEFGAAQKGQLDEKELMCLLEQLNGDREVPKEVAQWILDQADLSKSGALTRMELARGIAAWYKWSGQQDASGLGDKSKLSGFIEKGNDLPCYVPPQRGSCACTIS